MTGEYPLMVVRVQVFYHKMKGDYHRYLAEFATGTTRSSSSEASLEACSFPFVLACLLLLTAAPRPLRQDGVHHRLD